MSQGATLADSPKLGFTFDFVIHRLIQMHASSLLNLSGTAEVCLTQQATQKRKRGPDTEAVTGSQGM